MRYIAILFFFLVSSCCKKKEISLCKCNMTCSIACDYSKELSSTFAMIKPHAVNQKKEIIKLIEENQEFEILYSKDDTLTEEKFNCIYGIHEKKPFFNELKKNFVNKNVVFIKLKCNNLQNNQSCQDKFRLLAGNTNPKLAAKNTIRKIFGIDKQNNGIHSSDSPNSANNEYQCAFF